MATRKLVAQLAAQIDLFKGFNFDAAFKSNLGDESLSRVFGSKIPSLVKELERAQFVVDDANDTTIAELTKAVTAAIQRVQQVASSDSATFIQNRSDYRTTLSDAFDKVEGALLPFRVIAQEGMLRDLLETPNQSTLQSTQDYLKAETDTIIAEVRREAEAILAEAKDQANAIHTTARNTATGVSLITAQDHFAALLGNFKIGAIASAIVAVTSFVFFLGYAVYLLYHPPETATYPAAVFSIAIRVTVLGSLATIVGVALKIFRSNLHLLYHTLHRRQLTNSIPTFVDAARTDEQRDIVFVKLVEAISSFGNFGLINSGDEIPNTSKIVVDMLPKLFGTQTGKA